MPAAVEDAISSDTATSGKGSGIASEKSSEPSDWRLLLHRNWGLQKTVSYAVGSIIPLRNSIIKFLNGIPCLPKYDLPELPDMHDFSKDPGNFNLACRLTMETIFVEPIL